MVPRTGKTTSAVNNGQIIRMNPVYKKYGFNVAAVIFGAVLVLLLFRRCGDGGTKHSGQDTIKREIIIDTVRVHDTVKSYVPQPYKVAVPYKVEVPQNNDSLILALAIKDGILSAKDDSISILRQYLSTRYYSDKQKVQYGTVTINDTVTRNRIVGRSLVADFNIPVKTQTFTIEAQRRTTLYLGGDVYGNGNAPISYVGGSLGLQFRNGKMYEAKFLFSKDGNTLFGGGFRLPIKLHKK